MPADMCLHSANFGFTPALCRLVPSSNRTLIPLSSNTNISLVHATLQLDAVVVTAEKEEAKIKSQIGSS